MKAKDVISKVKDTAKSVKDAVIEKAAATEKVAKVIAARTKGAIAYQKVIESGEKPESYIKVGEILNQIKEAEKTTVKMRKILGNLKTQLAGNQFSVAQKSLVFTEFLKKYA